MLDGRIFFLKAQFLHDLSHQWSLKEMAESVELSVPHLQRLFKRNLGRSPVTYLNDLRLERAKELLESRFCRIKEIGIEIGIRSSSQFTRDFKRKYSVTPSVYRNAHWRKKQSVVDQQ